MIGTVSIIGLAVIGFFNSSPIWIVPFSILNTLIGMFTPFGRIKRIREMGGTLLGFFLRTLPLQAVLAAAIFGVFYGIGHLLH